MTTLNLKVSNVDKTTAPPPQLPSYLALAKAAESFFVISGTNQGMTFLDIETQRIYNCLNVAAHVNALSSDDVGWRDVDSYKHWRSIIPTPEYHPNKPAIIPDKPGLYIKNLWQTPEVQPDLEADISPFMDFMNFAFGEEEAQYIIKWLSWQYQYPLEKPHTGLYFYGPQGTGKGFIADVLEAVFGRSALTRLADSVKLKSMSNVELWQRTLLIVEEVNIEHADKAIANTIKSYMGARKTNADKKNTHFTEYDIPANPIFLSNDAPKFLEPDDRRWFVREMKKQTDTDYYSRLYDWLESGGAGAVALLLATTNVSDVKLSDRPLMTPEKQGACGISIKDDVLILANNMEAVLKAGYACVFTPAYFSKDYGNRLQHVAHEVGLKAVDLNDISGNTKTRASGFTASECRRFYVPEDAVVFQNTAHKNAWWITSERWDVNSALSDKKIPARNFY